MEKYINLQTFLNNEEHIEKIDRHLTNLLIFASNSKFDREINNRIPLVNKITKVKNGEKDYIFEYKNKEYHFSVFSDRELQQFDKKILKKTKSRHKADLLRTLKLACSMDLIDPKVIIGKSVCGNLVLLISYQEKGIDKVIDYARNLEMNKQDYYELFKFKEYNQLDKMDLYTIYYLLDKTNDYKHVFEYLLFSKEIIEDISKNFSYLTDKYDENGINANNYLLFGNNCDVLFFQEQDINYKYQIKDEIDDFTLNPNNRTKHIKYIPDKGVYRLKERNFGYFTFDLLSDMVTNEEIKLELLSDQRFGKCHRNAVRIANGLSEKDKQHTYVVGGKIKCNEIDYFFHSWAEIENGEKSIVIDFNHNIIMNREKFYKLYEAEAISKTQIIEMNDIIQITKDAGFNFTHMDLNYFGKEIMRDLKKNEKIFRK